MQTNIAAASGPLQGGKIAVPHPRAVSVNATLDSRVRPLPSFPGDAVGLLEYRTIRDRGGQPPGRIARVVSVAANLTHPLPALSARVVQPA